jgi:hypothetical protein
MALEQTLRGSAVRSNAESELRLPRTPFVTNFWLADNPLGGFMHGCFQGKNVHDARNTAMRASARGGIM